MTIINPNISITADGTKIRFRDYDAEFPESMDVKITNKCFQKCSYCHEESTPDGKHFDLNKAIDLFESLPYPTELALGGGNPALLDYEINTMVKALRNNCLVNVTLNYKDVLPVDYIRANAFGVSMPPNFTPNKNNLMGLRNLVIHLIIGVNTLEDLDYYQRNFPRVLILGYKTYGRGKVDPPLKEIEHWARDVGSVFQQYPPSDCTIAFDNLALQQLDLRRYFSKERWERFYMGDDGKYTMYLDLVKEEYAKSSTSQRYSIGNKSVKEMFAALKSTN